MAHHAKLQWNNVGLSFSGTVDSREDHPLRLGWSQQGHSDGLSPMGLVLGGLAGCTAMDVMSVLGKKRQVVTFFEVEVEGSQVVEHPQVYRDITIVYRFKGENLDPKAVERAIELSITKYCPVNAMLREVADIKTRYEILD